MSSHEYAPLTPEELAEQGVTALPAKEVISILDLAADIDLAIDGAAPIDLAIALNANIGRQRSIIQSGRERRIGQKSRGGL